MSSKWIISHANETFIAVLERRGSDLLQQVKNSSSDPDKFDACDRRWKEFLEFSTAVLRVHEAVTNPLKLLRPVCEENGEVVPDYYVLKVKSWSGYYRIDASARVCTGVLIRHDEDDSLEALANTLSGAFEKERPKGKD